MPSRTTEEIAAQVERLKALRGKIVEATYFGDSNADALEAEISTLEKGWDEDYIEDNIVDPTINFHALLAVQWRNRENDPESEDLAAGWPLKEDQK